MLQGSTWGNQWDYWDKFNNEGDGSFHILDHRVMFDGPTRTIWILEDIDEIDVKLHLYSDWKEWSLLYDHTKFLQAFETEGGRPISDTERLGDTYLMINDWTIRQRDHDTPVNVIGNIYAYDLTDTPKDPFGFDPTGSRSITSTVSNLVNIVTPDVSGIVIDYTEVATAVWDALKASYNTAGTMGEQMNNIPTAPTIADAVWDKSTSENTTADTRGAEATLSHEESRRARAMQTNKVSIVSVGEGESQVDTITVYDDDGVTVLYELRVTGEDCDNRSVQYEKPM